MNRNFILSVLVLLATLSMVNAIPNQLYKRATIFRQCYDKYLPEIIVLQVAISPDPVVAGQNDTFTITGTFRDEITTGHKVAVQFVNPPHVTLFYEELCNYTKCPIPAGTEMIAKVPVPVPASFPTTNYYIEVSIASAPKESPSQLAGCAMTEVK